jgi:hypothetical protein
VDTSRSLLHSNARAAGVTRRTAFGRVAGAGIAAALVAASRQPGALAQATPSPAVAGGDAPNHYVLSKGQTQIVYDTETFAGGPQLTYHGPIGAGPIDKRPVDQVTAARDAIQTEQVLPLGQLVTVYLGAIADGATFYLTLLLPGFNPVSGGAAPIPFTTPAILTTELTTIAGPGQIEGALREYAVLELEGTAEFVVP